MFKKLFLPLCLLVATASHASALEQWLDANNARAQYEMLSEENKRELACTIEAFEKIFNDVQEKVAEAVKKHEMGVETIKELLGVKRLNFSMAFTAGEDDVNADMTRELALEEEEEQKEAAAAA